MNRFACPALVAALSLSAMPALAQAGSDSSWRLGLGAATDNRSKQISKSEGRPYAWGEADWESADGLFYGGPAFETIRGSTGSDLEVSLHAGIRPEIAGYEVNLNVKRQWHVDALPTADDNAWELTADVARAIGPARGRLRLQHSPDGTGSTGAWVWVEGQVEWEFTPRLSGSASLGRRSQDRGADYTGWSVGAAWRLNRAASLELTYHGNDASAAGRRYDDALVLGVGVAF